jgi:lipoprotein-releasing system ATP-binding protein
MSDPAGPVMRVEALHKAFYHKGRTLEVLRGVDLSVAPGERVAIIGTSGSGKSTFLQVVGTIDQPSAGRVLFEGRDIFRMTEEELSRFRNREIGFIFQFHYLINELTAEENVALPALIAGARDQHARERACELLARVGLSDRGSHRPTELSGGEQQRVAIARALVNRPRIVLADEPTGNLDEHTAEDVNSLLLELNRETRVAFLVTTHNRALADKMDRILRLHEGIFEEVDA